MHFDLKLSCPVEGSVNWVDYGACQELCVGLEASFLQKRSHGH